MASTNNLSDKERIVALEVNLNNFLEKLREHIEEEEVFHADHRKCMTSLKEEVQKINKAFEKYQGFVGGMMLIVTGIGSVLFFFKSWVLTKLGIPL